MDWPIIDFLFNLIVLSVAICWLITIWAIIIGMIRRFLKTSKHKFK